jgi:hypothetical protein
MCILAETCNGEIIWKVGTEHDASRLGSLAWQLNVGPCGFSVRKEEIFNAINSIRQLLSNVLISEIFSLIDCPSNFSSSLSFKEETNYNLQIFEAITKGTLWLFFFFNIRKLSPFLFYADLFVRKLELNFQARHLCLGVTGVRGRNQYEFYIMDAHKMSALIRSGVQVVMPWCTH